jgi:hypothetical protein
MRLLRHMIEKKIESSQYYQLKKFYGKYYWQFYQAFCLSCAVLHIKLEKRDIKIRNKLYRKILLKKGLSNKQEEKMNNLMNLDMETITKALDYIQKINETSSTFIATYDKDKFIGILAQELDIE